MSLARRIPTRTPLHKKIDWFNVLTFVIYVAALGVVLYDLYVSRPF